MIDAVLVFNDSMQKKLLSFEDLSPTIHVFDGVSNVALSGISDTEPMLCIRYLVKFCRCMHLSTIAGLIAVCRDGARQLDMMICQRSNGICTDL